MHAILYGEGDFSFTAALTKADVGTVESVLGKEVTKITSTSLDSFEEVVQKYPNFRGLNFGSKFFQIETLHSVNALSVEMLTGDVATVLWNHPHLGVENACVHYQLLCHFFHVHGVKGVRSVVVSLLAGQDSRWRILEAAEKAGYGLVRKMRMEEKKFPGYTCKRNLSGTSFKSQHAIDNMRKGDVDSFFYFFELGVDKIQRELVELEGVNDVPSPALPTWVCALCPNKSFRSEQGLRTHNRQVHELEMYQKTGPVACDHCGEEFGSPGSLQSHFKAKHELISESVSPSSKRPRSDDYLCSICGSSDEGHLSNFSRNREDVYLCMHCDRTFREERALQQHIAQKHSTDDEKVLNHRSLSPS